MAKEEMKNTAEENAVAIPLDTAAENAVAMEELKARLEAAEAENKKLKKNLKKAEEEAEAERKLTEGQKQALMERNFRQVMEEEKQKKTTIRLSLKESGENEEVFVAVNGEKYLIQRGVDVEVPEFVAEVLKDSEAQRMAAWRKQQELQEMAKEKGI